MSHTRRTQPHQGPLLDEVRRILNAVGLPSATTDDRAQAHGILLENDGDDVIVEWFISRSGREAAALEQREGNPNGDLTALHARARMALHDCISLTLSAVGYSALQTETGALCVRGSKRPQAATRVAALLDAVRHELTTPAPEPAGQPGDPSPKPPGKHGQRGSD